MAAPGMSNVARKGMPRPPRLTHPRASIRYFDEDHCVAWHGNVQLILSHEAPTVPAMTAMMEHLDRLSVATEAAIGCLLIIHSDVSPPSEQVREIIRLKLERSRMVAASQVVLGTGFRGAAMRSMLSLLQLAMRPHFEMRIFGDIEAGARWLCGALSKRDPTGHNSLPPASLCLTAKELASQFFSADLK